MEQHTTWYSLLFLLSQQKNDVMSNIKEYYQVPAFRFWENDCMNTKISILSFCPSGGILVN